MLMLTSLEQLTSLGFIFSICKAQISHQLLGVMGGLEVSGVCVSTGTGGRMHSSDRSDGIRGRYRQKSPSVFSL